MAGKRSPHIISGVQTLRPAAKAGIVCGGFTAALAVSWVAVAIRQRLTQGPEAQASSGMYAFGDLALGVIVFGVLALGPLGLGLFWLRPVARFWATVTWFALAYACTSPVALVVSGWQRASAGSWALLADARIGVMPLGALVLAAGGLFAPQPRSRWILVATALVEGGLFAGIVFAKFVLPPR